MVDINVQDWRSGFGQRLTTKAWVGMTRECGLLRCSLRRMSLCWTSITLSDGRTLAWSGRGDATRNQADADHPSRHRNAVAVQPRWLLLCHTASWLFAKTGPERGLLGMAFPPDAATSGYVFFSFTDLNGDLVVARFNRTFADRFSTPRTVRGTRLDLKWSTGERVIRQPSANNNGGHLAFGPDGYLYVGVGDGGGVNDPQNNAQNPNTLLGKMLRINVRIPAGDPNGFQVPADNPFLEGVPIAALPEIWSFGWRNLALQLRRFW